MRTKWQPKDFVVIGVFAALTFAASFVLGSAITATAGPGMSGIATIIVTTIVVVCGAKIIDRFGAVWLMVVLYSFFAIPTTMLGPPGPHKLLVGLLTGVAYDGVIFLLRRGSWAYRLAGGTGAAVAILAIWGLFAVFSPPGWDKAADKIHKLAAFIVPFYFLLGVVGGHLGDWLYNKSLKDLAVVQNLNSIGKHQSTTGNRNGS